MDGRKYDHMTLESIRLLAMDKVANGESPASVVQSLGLSRSCIYRWMAKFRDGGTGALKAKRIVGRPKKLELEQSEAVLKTLVAHAPNDFHLGGGLWTRELVGDLLRYQHGLELSPASVARLFVQLGVVAHPPLYKFFRTKPSSRLGAHAATEAEREWFAAEYVKIKTDARLNRAEIYFLWEPEKIRDGLLQLSAVDARGVEHFKLYTGPVSAASICEFLDGLCHGRSRPLYVVSRRHPLLRDPEFRSYAMAHRSRFSLYYLPVGLTQEKIADPDFRKNAEAQTNPSQNPSRSPALGWAIFVFALMFASVRMAWASAPGTGLAAVYFESPAGHDHEVEMVVDTLEFCGAKDTLRLSLEFPAFKSKELSGRQVLLCEQPLPVGQYSSLGVCLKHIRAAPHAGQPLSAYPDQRVEIPLGIDVRPGSAFPIFLVWESGKDASDGKALRPSLTVQGARTVATGSLMFIANSGSHTVTCADRFGQRVVDVVAVGQNPRDLAYASRRQEVFTANSGSDNVSVIDAHTCRLQRSIALRVGDDPMRLAVSADQNRLYVLNAGSNSVSIIDLAGYRETRRVRLEAAPASFAVDEQNQVVYVASPESERLFGIDPASFAVATVQRFAGNLGEVVYTGGDRRLMVSLPAQRQVAFVDIARNSVLANLRMCAPAQGFAWQPTLRVLFASLPECNSIAILKPENNLEIGSINLDRTPGKIALDPETKRLVVVFPNAGKIGFYNANSWENQGYLDTGKNPEAVSFAQ